MNLFSRTATAAAVVMCAAGWSTATTAGGAYIRQPDLNGDRIVFVAEGDLWVAPTQGGAARRLTTHPGSEYFPRFSPDGKWIAFTGEYDGNRDVFVIPAGGGEPRRLTWNPSPDEVVGWTPDGGRVLFRTILSTPPGWEMYAVAATGGEPEKLPIGWAARLAIDPQSGLWAFNRTSWETRTWKRYRGGTAPDIWVGDPKRADFKVVTSFAGVNAYPMWFSGRIYFLSDQGGTMNLWSMKPDGSDRTRHTEFTDFDVRWPAISPDGRISFTLGADLWIYDCASGKAHGVAVEVPSDRVLTRTRYPEAARTTTWFDLAPKADRLAVVTRGEVFSVAVKDGVTLPVSKGSGARESWASYSPDGTRLVFVSDATREEDIRTIDAWGRGAATVVAPAGASGYHFPPRYSPDGTKIAFADQTQTLYVMPAAGGAATKVDRSEQGEIQDYVWSPDGRFLAYARPARTGYTSVLIHDTRDGANHLVSGGTTNDSSPAWDPQGRYLYFVSERLTNPTLDSRDLANIEQRNNGIFAAVLKKDGRSPFANWNGLPDDDGKPTSAVKDAAGATADAKAPEAKKDAGTKEAKGKDEPPTPVAIDFAGLADRVIQLPIERGNYARIAATAKTVFFLSVPARGMAEEPGMFAEGDPEATLMSFDLEKRKAKTFIDGVSAYVVALKADRLAVMRKKGDIHVVDAGGPGDLGEAKVDLSSVVVELDPREEWAQIYFEAWRQMRDFYWDPGMGGVDWKAVRDRYATLLPRLSSREDLRDLIGEVIGELATSHTYVFGGDSGVKVPRVSTGLLGADVTRDGDAVRVSRILRADPADNVRSPLAEPGVNVREGDFILEVDHEPLAKDRPFAAALANRAGKDVVLTVNTKPTRDGARDVVVRTLADEGGLRYADWVRRNREYVAARTGGAIGYLHLPNMGAEGMIAFNTWFYPQLDRQGMIVDCRWNGGGFVSQMILERFRRRVLTFDRSRQGAVETYPARALNGPFVVLTNEFAGSDGDIFPAAVQIEKLAPVIGMRSWGGVIGIRGDKQMVDGGLLTEPEFAWWDPKGGWTIENHGVDPDIVVQNPPQDLAKGIDAQLDRAIAEVEKLRTQRPPVVPKFAPPRDRSRGAFAGEAKK